MANHSSILTWEIPLIKEPGRLQSMDSQKSWTWWSVHTHTYITKYTLAIFMIYAMINYANHKK